MESNDLQSALHMSHSEAGYGLGDGQWGRRYQGHCRALGPLGHQGYRLCSYKKDAPLHSRYMVAEEIMTLLLGSPLIPCDHRALAGLSLFLSHFVFPPRLHSWHLPSGPKMVLLILLTVVIDIGLEFILVLIVV